jgi:3-oxoacyl-[acyl-carrier protein] reductase
VRALDGKVAIVTGSGRGIGREIARKLAADGASLVVNDLDDIPAKAAVEEIVDNGGSAVAVPGDVTAPQFGEEVIDAAVSAYGGIDIIVNNAGYTWDTLIQKMTDEQWATILDVHLTAPFRLLRAAQRVISDAAKRELAEHGVARCRKVINISSIAGLGGNAGQTNYAAAKAGVVGLTKTLAKEWGRYNVAVNAVAFGLIRTRLTAAPSSGGSAIDVQGRQIRVGMSEEQAEALTQSIPLGRAGTPSDAAGAVYLLCRPEADYISGHTLVCAGGYSV